MSGNVVDLDVWFLVQPDSGDLVEYGFDVCNEIECLAIDNGVLLEWYSETRDTGFGLERLARIKGLEEDVDRFLMFVNSWV